MIFINHHCTSIIFWINLLVLVLYVGCDAASRVVLDRHDYFSNIDVNISWSIDMDTKEIFIELIAPVNNDNAWIAFGISDTGGMKGADIALTSVYHKKIYDTHSNDFVLPLMDKIQNWKLQYFERIPSNDQTIIQIKRSLLTCDSEDYDINTRQRKHNLMIAYNPNDMLLPATTDSKLMISQHSEMQRKEINLFLDETLFMNEQNDVDLNNVSYIEFRMGGEVNLSYANGDTQYWCKSFNNTQERYITNLRVVDDTNMGLFHHTRVLLCPNYDKASKYAAFGKVERCESEFQEMDCELYVALAGSTSIDLTSNMHYQLRAGIVMLEIHYDLNALPSNDIEILNDNSGVRFYYDTEARETEVGVITVEAGEFVIPPKKKHYELSAMMHSTCTNKLLPSDGIDIIRITGHMHYIGSGLRLDRIRYPNQIKTIYELKQWDFDRQFGTNVYYTLKPNDTLRLTCIFDSSTRENDTIHGIRVYDEMCVVFISYANEYVIDDFKCAYSIGVHGDDEVLNPSYCGPNYIKLWELAENEGLIYENELQLTTSNKHLEIMDNTSEICHAMVYDQIDLISNDLLWRFDLPYITLIPGIVILVGILFSFYVIEKVLSYFKPGIYYKFVNHREDKRKINIYVFSIIFFTVLLIFLLYELAAGIYVETAECEIIYSEHGEDDHEFGLISSANLLLIFFGVELLYRINVTWDLVLHHIFTIIIIIILTTSFQTTLATINFKWAFYYLLQVATEQPTFIALLIRKLQLNIMKKQNYPKLFYFASIWQYITKIITSIMIFYYYILLLTNTECNYWHVYDISYSLFLKYDTSNYQIESINLSTFTVIMFSIIAPLLFLLQLYQGFAVYKLGKPHDNYQDHLMTKKENCKLAVVLATKIQQQPNKQINDIIQELLDDGYDQTDIDGAVSIFEVLNEKEQEEEMVTLPSLTGDFEKNSLLSHEKYFSQGY